MKGLCTRLLLSVTCFSLCLTFASPVRAGENAAQVFPQVQADTEGEDSSGEGTARGSSEHDASES